MDTLSRYRAILKELLEEYASLRKSATPDIKTQLVTDTVHDHYQLLAIGWHNNRFVYNVMLHFDLIDKQVWIQQNNTDALIADELVQRGVDPDDIVLGFISEQARRHSKLHRA
ncbi:XisI protein [Spirosoma rhododendri]|uniref:XisI protein n=1 Tax=Spirosoma rhododendri TaxID=2728024 RepID=A0A7L5DYE4_9BACT|nr:XisI protein [Spirosoma rhododendri]QJD80540.1 XisI protein [Spirosoma rhododendri]